VSRRTERESAWAAAPSKLGADPRVYAAQLRPFSPTRSPIAEHSDVDGLRGFDFHPAIDDLPEEQTVSIEINGRPVAALICTPVAVRELAIGWAFTNRYIASHDDLRRITVYPGRVSLMVEDPSNGGVSWSSLLIGAVDPSAAPDIPDLPDGSLSLRLRDEEERERRWRISRERFLGIVARVFYRFENDRCANGYHHAAAADDEGVCIIGRDITRQNAVDKIVGWTVLDQRPRESLILCLSGRMTADIVHKAWSADFPIVASRSLPTADAVDFADLAGITLVGSALDTRRAVYSHAWRLIDDEEDISPDGRLPPVGEKVARSAG
jgi:FdhD protein